MKKQRIVAWALSLSMIFSSFSFNTFAQDTNAADTDADVVSSEAAVAVDVANDDSTLSTLDDTNDFSAFINATSPWKASVYGNLGEDYKNYTAENFLVTGTADSAELKAANNVGKIDGSANEGLAFYYQELSNSDDFTISATAEVQADSTSLGMTQVSFGVMLKDTIYVNETYGGGGASYGNGVYAGLLAMDKAAAGNMLSSFVRKDGKYSAAATTSVKSAYAEAPVGGEKYDITIKKSGSTYKVKFGDDPEVTYGEDDVTLTGDKIYAGVYVARGVHVKFTNLKIAKEGAVELGDWVSGMTSTSVIGSKGTVTPDGNSVNLKVEGNKGKLSASEETIVYYTQEISADADFELSGKVTVNSVSASGDSNPQQSSFGLAILNELYDHGGSNDTVTAKVTNGVYNAWYAAKSTDTEGYIAPMARLAAAAATRDVQSAISDSYPIKGTDIGTFDLSIKKTGTNYKVSCGDKSYTFSDDAGRLTGTIYPMFFVARNADITVTDYKLDVETKTATGLTINSKPSKTVYYVGEEFDTTGLKVSVDYDNGTSEEASLEDLAITGFDSETAGTKTIKVTKGKVSQTFTVTVNPIKVTNIKIDTEPALNVYNIGAVFNPAGATVVATYEDGTTETLKASQVVYTIDGKVFDSTTAFTSDFVGAKTVKVSRLETDTINPNGVYATYNITVGSATVESIKVAVTPKQVYYVGDEIDTNGLVIRATYSDGTEANLKESEYTVSGFSSSTTTNGYADMTITYNINPSITTSYQYGVYAVMPERLMIDTYPRTTFDINEDFNSEGLVVNVFYNNETTTTAVEGTDYTIDLSDYNAKKGAAGEAVVKIVPTNSSFDSIEFSVTIREAQKFIWRGAIFGQSSGGAGNDDNESALQGGKSEVIVPNYGTVDGTMTIKSWNGAGKVTGDHDGIAYYYTTVPNEDNFTLSADIYVRGYLGAETGPYNVDEKRSGQEGFGLMARDVIPLQDEDGNRVVNPSEAAKDDEGVARPYNKGSVFASNMVLAGGYSGTSWPADLTTASGQKNARINRINLVARTGVTNWVSGTDGASGTTVGPKKISSTVPLAGIHTEEGDTTHVKLSGKESDQTCTGDTYRITLKRVNLEKDEASGTVLRGLQATCTNLGTGETMTENLDDSSVNNMFEAQNDQVYVGFFAARWAIIDVTNVKFYTSNPMTDEVVEVSKNDAVIPSVSVSSSLFTTDEYYTLTVKTNNDNGGYITVSQNGEVVYQDRKVSAKTSKIPLTLVKNTTNTVTVVYTPSTLDNLTSYSPITKTVEIVHKDGDTFVGEEEDGSQIWYVSPTGSANGDGTRENPFDLDTALGFVSDGQTIIMLDGTYSHPNTITIASGKSGRTGKISLIADEGASPIIDFETQGEGFNLAASYWHIKGITIARCGDNSHGMNVGGNYNTIEDCTFVENGGTG
jgi:hypothetical protein